MQIYESEGVAEI